MNNRTGLTTVSAIADSAVSNIGQPVQAEYVGKGTQAGEDLVNEICDKLRASCKGYKAKMGSSHGETEYKKQMLLALAESRVTHIDLCAGALAHYRANDEWMPTPAQFVAQVEKFTIGDIPSAKDAYFEYCNKFANRKHQWSHPIVKATVDSAGIGYEMKSLPTERALPIYERSYQILRERLRKGEDIEIPVPKAIPEKIGRVCSTKENKANLARLMEGL